jgi:hypothetical protein
MTRVVLFNNQSANIDSPTFEIKGQRTFMSTGMQPGDFMTFEIVKVAAGARSTVCGCRISEMGVGVIEGVQELQCSSCEETTQRPVRMTPQNPVVVLDFPQGVIMRAIYTGDGLDLRTVTVWSEESTTQDLTPELRGCPPIYVSEADMAWSDTGNYRCVTGGGIQYEQTNDCGRRRWFLDVIRPQIWVDTVNTRCTSNGIGVEVEQTNQCGDRRWQLSLTLLQEWVANGVHRCTSTGDVELQEINQCGDRRWVVCGSVEWVDTGKFRCGLVNLENEQTNQCGHRRWFATATPLTWTTTGVTRCSGADLEAQETNNCGIERWTVVGPNTWTLTGVTSCVSGTVRNQETDLCGNLRLVNTGTPCGDSTHIVASVTRAPLSAPEGSTFCWTVTLNTPVVGSPLTLGGALSGSEQDEHSYPFPSVTIPVGQISGQMCVGTTTDFLVTSDLNLCLQVQPNARLSGIPAALCVTVTEGPGAPQFSTHTILTITPDVNPIIEGDNACWNVTLNSPVTGANLPISFSLSGSEQTIHSYPAPSLIIPIGATTGQVCVATTDDLVDEPDRMLGLTALISGRILGVPAVSNITVQDNDEPTPDVSTHTVITLVGAPPEAPEGTTFCWTATLSSPVTGADLLLVSTLSGDEQGIHNYAAPTVLILIGESSGQMCVATIDDPTREPTRVLTLGLLTSPRVTAVPAAVSVNVLDNDPIPEPLAFSGDDQGGDCLSNAELIQVTADFRLDGVLSVQNNVNLGSLDFPWLPPGGLTAEYEVRCNDTSAVGITRTGSTRGVWLNAATLRQFVWTLGTTGVPATRILNATFSVRRITSASADTTLSYTGVALAYKQQCD